MLSRLRRGVGKSGRWKDGKLVSWKVGEFGGLSGENWVLRCRGPDGSRGG